MKQNNQIYCIYHIVVITFCVSHSFYFQFNFFFFFKYETIESTHNAKYETNIYLRFTKINSMDIIIRKYDLIVIYLHFQGSIFFSSSSSLNPSFIFPCYITHRTTMCVLYIYLSIYLYTFYTTQRFYHRRLLVEHNTIRTPKL